MAILAVDETTSWCDLEALEEFVSLGLAAAKRLAPEQNV
jgi:hypothetical protein